MSGQHKITIQEEIEKKIKEQTVITKFDKTDNIVIIKQPVDDDKTDVCFAVSKTIDHINKDYIYYAPTILKDLFQKFSVYLETDLIIGLTEDHRKFLEAIESNYTKITQELSRTLRGVAFDNKGNDKLYYYSIPSLNQIKSALKECGFDETSSIIKSVLLEQLRYVLYVTILFTKSYEGYIFKEALEPVGK